MDPKNVDKLGKFILAIIAIIPLIKRCGGKIKKRILKK